MTTRIPGWAKYGKYYTDDGTWTGRFYATEQEAKDAERNLGNSYFAIAAVERERKRQ